jgi:hypothetical protein
VKHVSPAEIKAKIIETDKAILQNKQDQAQLLIDYHMGDFSGWEEDATCRELRQKRGRKVQRALQDVQRGLNVMGCGGGHHSLLMGVGNLHHVRDGGVHKHYTYYGGQGQYYGSNGGRVSGVEASRRRRYF